MMKLLIIGLVWPEPTTTAAGTRMIQLINFFKSSHEIIFACAAAKTENSFDLEAIGVQTHIIKLNDCSFDTFIRDLSPEIVLFDRFLTEEQYGWRVTENTPNAMKLLDTEDLHFVRKAREIALKRNEDYKSHILNDIAKRELASIFRCDLTLIISKFEYKLLVNNFNIDEKIIIYTPFLEEKIDSFLKYPSFDDRNDFISIGNFNHKPNWQSVLTLKQSVWPKIREKLPKAQLKIYGAYANNKVLQLHNINEGFIIKGWAENVEEVFSKARILLAPLQFGAGLKGKIVDSMKYGTPNITTSIGAEGMNYTNFWNGYIEDHINSFTEKSIDLYQNKEKWLESQKNGKLIFNKMFSKEKFEAKLFERIQQLHLDLEKHRKANFIGEILQYHTLKSTKYMSKWIEEKNKH